MLLFCILGLSETNLSTLLPECAWPVFEDVLDFIYKGKVPDFRADSVVVFLAWADALQVRAFFEQAILAIKEEFLGDAEHAPQLLLDTAAFLGGGAPVRTQIEDRAAICVAEHLDKYTPGQLLRLPQGALEAVLLRDCFGGRVDRCIHLPCVCEVELREFLAAVSTLLSEEPRQQQVTPLYK